MDDGILEIPVVIRIHSGTLSKPFVSPLVLLGTIAQAGLDTTVQGRQRTLKVGRVDIRLRGQKADVEPALHALSKAKKGQGAAALYDLAGQCAGKAGNVHEWHIEPRRCRPWHLIRKNAGNLPVAPAAHRCALWRCAAVRPVPACVAAHRATPVDPVTQGAGRAPPSCQGAARERRHRGRTPMWRVRRLLPTPHEPVPPRAAYP